MTLPTRGWKSDEERGPIGAWFVRAIGERSIEQVARDLAERGHAHKPDYYRGIMAGSKRPGCALLAALSDYLGSSPIPPNERPTDQGALIAALDAQTQAIRDLVGRLDVLITGQVASAGEVMQALAALGAHPDRPRTDTGAKPGAHARTGR